MKDFKFDIDEFIKIAKEKGAEITEGTGKFLINGREMQVSEDIEEYLRRAREHHE